MNHKPKAVFNWSGGKDSALALQQTLQTNQLEVVSLLTTINEATSLSSIHGIPLEILHQQADSIGIPLYTVSLSPDLKEYDRKMEEAVVHFTKQGVTHFIFGDIFLSDVKAYRENKLNPFGIEVVEPLWNKTSKAIIAEFLQSGIKTKIIVTQADKLDATYVGKELDSDLVASFPDGVDYCGENGEYHTLCYAGSIFKKEIAFSLGKTQQFTYDINLADGETKTFAYWQAPIIVH